METFNIQTRQNKQVVNITARLNEMIRAAGLENGLCSVTCLHTTAALTTADLDPGTDQDMLDAFTAMIPDLDFRHPHNPAHAPDHILASLLGPTVTLPVSNGRLVLGTWQEVVLFEFDGPRSRTLTLTLIRES